MRNKIGIILLTISSLVALVLAVSFFVRFWFVELYVSFAPLVIIGLFILLSLSIILLFLNKTKKPKNFIYVVFILTLLMILFDLCYSLNTVPASNPQNKIGEVIKFATFNKMYSNGDISKISNYIKRNNIDVVALQEVKEAELKLLASQTGLKYYDLSKPISMEHKSSVGIISKLPVSSFIDNNFGDGYGALTASVRTLTGSNFVVYSVHLISPLNSRSKSNEQIDTLSSLLINEKQPVIIGGDFNTTVFSEKIRDFDKKTNNSLKATITENWPKCSWFGLGEIACMRIDQVYISKALTLKSEIIAPNLGSDHRMIMIEAVF